jgi:hypothetical protein
VLPKGKNGAREGGVRGGGVRDAVAVSSVGNNDARLGEARRVERVAQRHNIITRSPRTLVPYLKKGKQIVG